MLSAPLVSQTIAEERRSEEYGYSAAQFARNLFVAGSLFEYKQGRPIAAALFAFLAACIEPYTHKERNRINDANAELRRLAQVSIYYRKI